VHKKMRDFSKNFKTTIFFFFFLVCHQVITYFGNIVTGDLVLVLDYHTFTYGAICAFSTGVGSTDLAIALATGKNWFKVPATIKIIIKGKLPGGVFAKDIILYIIGKLKSDGATYKAFEFSGPVIDSLGMDGRFTIANMLVEMGAKAGFMPVDQKTLHWLKLYVRRQKKVEGVFADKGAIYERVYEFDISKLKPMISMPHSVDNVAQACSLSGVKINEAFLGTCTNGRIDDFKAAAKVLNNRKISPLVKLIIAPSSRSVYLESLRLGLVEIFIKAGAVIVGPGCGACVGTHNGIPSDNEVVISTANRNFKGRMGNPAAFIYLASPATVAASAIKGCISDPRGYF